MYLRPKISLRCVTLVIRVKKARPMGVEDCAMWVSGQVHMECWGEGLGTVLVKWSAQEKSVGVMGVLAGKTVGMFV
nr:hypothetical protein [Tanacetum cinerariifolium]